MSRCSVCTTRWRICPRFATCAIVSFLANDRLVFQRIQPHRGRLGATVSGLGLLVAMSAATVEAAELRPATIEAWTSYVEATERRISEELESDDGFLVQDFDTDGDMVRSELAAGAIHIKGNGVPDVPTVRPFRFSGGAIHHWRGGIFIPGVSLDDVLHGVQSPLKPRGPPGGRARVESPRADARPG